MILIPFGVGIPKAQQDVSLPEKLMAEASGILNWSLAGLPITYATACRSPIRSAVKPVPYKDENDLLGMWVREECELGVAHSQRKSALYSSYETWCSDNGTTPITQPRFTRRIKRGHGLMMASDERTIVGIRLKCSGGNL